MAVSFEFADDVRVLRMTLDGELTDAILLDIWQQAISVATALPPCKSIVDLSGITEVKVSTDTLTRVARTPVRPHQQTQVFVAPRELLYGMSRMFQILSEQTRHDLRIVHTIDEAYKLLGIEPPKFLPVSIPDRKPGLPTELPAPNSQSRKMG